MLLIIEDGHDERGNGFAIENKKKNQGWDFGGFD